MMATELLPHTDKLLADNNGKFVILNCKILQFKAKKDTWLQNEEQNDKKRKLFADIVDNTNQQDIMKTKKKKPVKVEVSFCMERHFNLFKDEVDELFAGNPVAPLKKSKKAKKEKKHSNVAVQKSEEDDESLNFILKSLQETKN
jgi:hypothetical protein